MASIIDTAIAQDDQGIVAAAGRDAFVELLLRSTKGAFDLFTIYLGDQLGLYEALAAAGEPLTAQSLAARTRTHERYVREWLEQQVVAGILAVDRADAPAEERCFHLPPGHAEVLADPESLNYLAPLAQMMAGVVRPLRFVLDAFRHGGGVPFGAYGADLREGQGRVNRAAFLHQLGPEWLGCIPGLDERLRAQPPARVADVGCGLGWSSIGLARSYPLARVDGIDLDEPSVARAREHARTHGVSDRVTFEARDAGADSLAGQYDLVMALECVHDLSDPVRVLRAMRRMVRPGGTVLVVDERVGDAFMAQGNDVEWMMYGWSVLHCLPVGMADEPSAATGTVMRTDTLRDYARRAGFQDVEVLPIDNFLFRFYRLRP